MTKKAVEYIEKDGELYAILIRENLPKEGYNFVSRDEHGLQVGVNHYKAGSVAVPHVHIDCERKINTTNEVLHIDSGKCVLVLYTDSRLRFYETTLWSGDTIVLLKGGHGIKFLEETRIVEVKQGPYLALGPADTAPWSQLAVAADAQRLLAWYATARVGERFTT